MAAKTKQVVTILSDPVEKKHVIRYDASDALVDPALRSVYVDKDALSKLGNPSKIKVTIEAA